MKQKNQNSSGSRLLPGVSYLTLIAIVVVLASCSSSRKTSKANVAPTQETTEKSEPPKQSQAIAPMAPPAPSAPIEENMIGLQTKYADMVEVTPEEITNGPLYKLIDEWWGAPYVSPPGATPQEGIDCSGFAALLQRTIYDTNISGSSANIATKVEPITREELREGDLVFFCCTTGSADRDKISHVGTYLTNGKFVHATTKKGVIITALDDPYYWKDKYVKSGRLTGEASNSNSNSINTSGTTNNSNSSSSGAAGNTTQNVIPATDNSGGTTISANALEGTASYYADAFEGRRTSSGEIFSQNNLTAASKNLPFNTMVKVTNIKNNKTVIVKVNDRMGQRGRHLIDLTTAAFKELGTLADGVLNVKIEVLQ